MVVGGKIICEGEGEKKVYKTGKKNKERAIKQTKKNTKIQHTFVLCNFLIVLLKSEEMFSRGTFVIRSHHFFVPSSFG